MQVAITVPQDQLQAAVRAEVGALFAGLLGGKAPAAPAQRAPRAKAAPAPAPAAEPAARKPRQSTAAPKAAEGPKTKTNGVQEGTNAATVLAAVKQGLSRADDIAEKTKLDKGQVNAGLAVLKRNGLINAVARGQYKAN